MNKVNFFVGIDISSEFFTVSILDSSDMSYLNFENFENSLDGFQNLLSGFRSAKVDHTNVIICMESTGVYGEKLAYFLVSSSFKLVIENPLNVKKAFNPNKGKTDKIDSEQIAEYACRFYDKLKLWTPKLEIIEEIRMFLTQRDQFISQRIVNMNAKHAVSKKHFKSEKVISNYDEIISSINKKIKTIEKEIMSLIEIDPEFRQTFANIQSIPGVGKVLGFNLITITNGFTEHIDHKKLASYLGIVPLPFQSGSSIRKRNSSSGMGPSKFRKVIYMASMSSTLCNKELKKYFERKVAEGKNKKLVINNISNKILKIIISIIKSKKPYINNFVPINPVFRK
jgi:transposase